MSKAKTAESNTESVTLAHGAFVDGKFVGPGEKVEVSNDAASSLRASGYVVSADADASLETDAPGT